MVASNIEGFEVLPIFLIALTESFFLFLPSAKQRHLKLLPQSALDKVDSEPVKIAETKGCQVFCTGLVGQTNTAYMCVAIKRTIQVYEVNKTRQRYRKTKDIQNPAPVQCLQILSDRLCVGSSMGFAIYSVLGDAGPICEYSKFFCH